VSHDPADPTGIDPATRARIALWARKNAQWLDDLEKNQPVTDEQLANEPQPPPEIWDDMWALGAQMAAEAVESTLTGRRPWFRGSTEAEALRNFADEIDPERNPSPEWFLAVESKLIAAEIIGEYMDGLAVSLEEVRRRANAPWRNAIREERNVQHAIADRAGSAHSAGSDGTSDDAATGAAIGSF
jgi:hypothetical protein